MHTWAMRIGTMIVVGLCMAATGCTDDGERPEDWTLDGDFRDARFEADAGDGSDLMDVRDTADVQGTTDTRDTADVAPLDCTCPVEGATCQRIDGRAVCLVDGAECDFDVHGAECRPECTEHTDCGDKQYCNVNGRCFPHRKCANRNHALCPPGHWCDSEDRICKRSGGKPVEATCEENWQCESGYCHEGTCIATCLSEEDCPQSERACDGFDEGFGSLNCYEPRNGYKDCKISCPQDQLCNYDECLPHACRRTSDCEDGDCLLYPGQYGFEDKLGRCSTGASRCKGYEFRISEEDPYCRLSFDYTGLYFDSDPCPKGYEWQPDPEEVLKDPVRVSGTSYCSRRVTDGQWPPDG